MSNNKRSFFQRAMSVIGLSYPRTGSESNLSPRRPIILSRLGDGTDVLSGPAGQVVADSNSPIPNLHPSARSTAELVKRINRQPSFTLATAALFALGQASSASIKHDKSNPREVKFAELMLKLWADHLAKAMSVNVWGRACFEKTYLPPTDPEMIRGVRLDFLEPKKSKIWREKGVNVGVKYREKGEISSTDGEKSKGGSGLADLVGNNGNGKDKDKDEICLAAHECYFVVIDQDSENPQGRSMYRGAAEEVVKSMEDLKRQKHLFNDKIAMGHGSLKAPSKYDPIPGQDGELAAYDPRTGKPMDPLEDGRAVINELRSGGSAVLPSEVHEGTNIPKWDYTPPTGSTANASFFLENERKLDDEAPMSIGVPPRAVSQNADVGSLAMSKTHLTVLEQRVFSAVDPLRKAFQEQVIDPAAKVNFATPPTFELVIDYVSIEQFTILLDLVKQITIAPMAPPLVANGVIDLRQLLEKVRVPVGETIASGGALPELNLPATMIPAGQPPAPGSPSTDGQGQLAMSAIAPAPPRVNRTSTDRQAIAAQAQSIDEVAAELSSRMGQRKDELLSAIMGGPGSIDRGKLANTFSQLERDMVTGIAGARLVGVSDLAKKAGEDPTVDDGSGKPGDDTLAGGQTDDTDMSPPPSPKPMPQPPWPAPLNMM